ncbi:MAG: hypothetical protein KDA99_29815, partial [Planctomycetales bacterium]|nr:hypothetical protein [Planctomycetales bacterium]
MTTGTHNLWTSAGAVRLRRYAHVATVCALLLSTMGGCASVTNPVANGVPARLVPDELLAPSKNELKTIPLNWLAQPDADVYKLASGDILGVYIEGILGEPDQPPPINFPDVADMPPSVGYPFPIGKDGTVPLPLVDPIKVEG